MRNNKQGEELKNKVQIINKVQELKQTRWGNNYKRCRNKHNKVQELNTTSQINTKGRNKPGQGRKIKRWENTKGRTKTNKVQELTKKVQTNYKMRTNQDKVRNNTKGAELKNNHKNTQQVIKCNIVLFISTKI
ncbi:hypothetical protein HYE05_03875 [Mycoplasmopsis bovis]|nr:hypothetical protein [Mycoplasmopsis bovis]QQH27665.1 hypothetical protein HYE05_03875 [Mycoplasmopsis bovis]